MASKTSFLDAMSTRRSIYALEASSPVPDSRIIEIVNHTILHCPSPFNVQSARAIVLIGEEHKKLWDIAYEAAQDIFSAAAFEGLKLRILGFRGGYGTVMWFEDEGRFNVLEQQMGPERWAGVKDKMPQWSEHSSGMHQYAVWTALEAEGLGCNLQHHNPWVDQRVQGEWNVSVDWSLKSQLVFGKPVGPPRDKTSLPTEERVFVHKS